MNDFLLNFVLSSFWDYMAVGGDNMNSSGSLGGKSAGALCAFQARDSLLLDLFRNKVS